MSEFVVLSFVVKDCRVPLAIVEFSREKATGLDAESVCCFFDKTDGRWLMLRMFRDVVD